MLITKRKLVSEFHLYHNNGALNYRLKKASLEELPIFVVYIYICIYINVIINARIQTMINLRGLRKEQRQLFFGNNCRK